MVDVTGALAELKRKHPGLNKAAIKMNEGFGGEGNAVFSFDGAPLDTSLEQWVSTILPERLEFEAEEEGWDSYSQKYAEMGGIVEAWVEGDDKTSPSVQCRINPLGEVKIISTHDQSLGGPSKQIYQGCTFPARQEYAKDIQESAGRVARLLKDRGVLGRFGIDYISVRESGEWKHYAIEINLRKGGTTHPFLMLQYLTDGSYDSSRLKYFSPTGQELYYRTSDDLVNEALHGLTPHDLIDIAVCNHLHFDAATQQGVVFHLLGAVSEYGKLGILCIGDSHARAHNLFERTVATFASESPV
jgi:hypothetical protein